MCVKINLSRHVIQQLTAQVTDRQMNNIASTYTRIRIQRSGAGVGNNGVRHKASIRQQSTRDFFFFFFFCPGVIIVLIGDKGAST